MKKIVLAVAIAMAGAWGIYQANQNNTKLSEIQVEELEAMAYWVDGEWVPDDPRDKKGSFNWASYAYGCEKYKPHRVEYGTICISGIGLCIWDDPCD